MPKYEFKEWSNQRKSARFDLRLSKNQLWLIEQIMKKQKGHIYYKGLRNRTAVIDRALASLGTSLKIIELLDQRYFEK